MANDKKKYFNVLRNNEDLSYGGLKTLKIIEDEFDRLAELEQCNQIVVETKPSIIDMFKCDICHNTPSLIIRTSKGTFCSEHVKY